jgi:hypothetical protein
MRITKFANRRRDDLFTVYLQFNRVFRGLFAVYLQFCVFFTIYDTQKSDLIVSS